MTYDEGKVYLRDKRNGNVYPYERYLAQDRNFEPHVPNPVKSEDAPDGNKSPAQQEAPSV